MIKTIAACAVIAGFAAVPALAAENGSNVEPSTQSSHPGVKGDVGGKNGPSAKPSEGSTGSSSSGTSAGSTPDGCTSFASYGSWQVSCPYAPVRLWLGDGNDRGSVASTTPQVTVPVMIDGGPGTSRKISRVLRR